MTYHNMYSIIISKQSYCNFRSFYICYKDMIVKGSPQGFGEEPVAGMSFEG